MLTVNETVGVLHRGGVLVATVEGLTGHFLPTTDGLRVAFNGRLVGRRSWWCEAGVEVELTFLAAPRRKKSKRLYCPALVIDSVDDERISLSGSTPLSFDPGWTGDITPEARK